MVLTDLSETRQCYVCNKPGHLARDCKMSKTESKGRPAPNRLRPAITKQVQASGDAAVSQERANPMEFLYSSDSEEESEVRIVRVMDRGSLSQCARLQVQGVPMFGIIDSWADITIMGGELFKKVAAAARLKRFQETRQGPSAIRSAAIHSGWAHGLRCHIW